MDHYFVFDGVRSSDYGVYVSGEGTFNAPARIYLMVDIPGRDGQLAIDGGRFENITVTYPCIAKANNIDAFAEMLANLRNALCSKTGYCRLADSIHPEEYRLGIYRSGLEIAPEHHAYFAQFDLEFDCKPQRFLVSGETVQSFTSAGEVYNPTRFDSLPLIKVTGYGTLGIGSNTITIANTYPYICIDSEIMDCYHDTDNANAAVSFSSNDFPVLSPGNTGIAISGSITKVEITPRWWRV